MTRKQILKFIEIWEKETGQKIKEDEVLELATTLLNLYRSVLGDYLQSNKKN